MKNILYILVIVLLSSCGNLKNVSLSSVDAVRVKNLKGTTATLEMDVTVDNPSGHNLFIKSADLDILLNGYTFAAAELHERVKIPRKSRETHSIAVNIQIKDILALAVGGGAKLLSGKSTDFSGISLTGKVKAGGKLFSKKYKFDNIDLSRLKEK